MVMEVGVRVVRGPDWKWGHQDGQEGHVGTVVEIGQAGNNNTPDKTVVVQWDSGFRTNYRVGYQGAYDLRVFDNATIGVKHPNIICDACKKPEMFGMRWKCTKCYDFDLCHLCYMSGKHDHSHTFMRFENANCVGAKVGKRAGLTRIEAKGVFAGAKVLRGVDWDWGNQDGGENKPGRVVDVRGWDQESGRSVANVTWAVGTTNVYRMGHKGKVDLKYVEPGSGGFYYKEHLPVLGQIPDHNVVPYLTTLSQFKVGDRVRVDLEVDILKAMQDGHGGWNPRMAEYVGRVGMVHRITDRGDVRVQYEGCINRWTFHPGSLTKVKQHAVGDFVRVKDNIEEVKELQRGHGEWTDNMLAALGKTGRVMKVYSDGDLRITLAGQTWTLNPACCSIVPYGQQTDNNTLGGAAAAQQDQERRQDPSDTLADILESLLEVQAPSTEPDKLVREAAQGHTDLVAEIISKHPDKVDQKSSGKTALQVASHQGHVDLVRLLLAAGASLQLQDEDGDTALHYSAFGNQPAVMELLLAAGPAGAVDGLNAGGCSTLHVAVNKQFAACVRVLLDHRADVNIQDSYGDTALHDAIGKDSRDIVELLTEYPGTDFTLRNKRGFNVLHHAALKGNNHATEKILHKTRQIVDSKKDDGFAALHLAALNGHHDVAQTLITLGRADIEIRNNRKQTPLLLAVSQGHTRLIELLVNNEADIDVEDEEGDTCLHLAVMSRQPNNPINSPPPSPDSHIAKIQKKVACRSVEDPSACEDMGTVIACYLIEKGAKTNHKNHQHKTAMDLVTDKRIAEITHKFIKLRELELRAKSSPAVAGGSSLDSGEPAGCGGPALVEAAAGDPGDSGAGCCQICWEAAAAVTLQPCGHTVVCTECCRKLKKCLVCRETIDRKIGPDGSELGTKATPGKPPPHETLIRLQAKVQEYEDTLNCGICMERPKSIVFACGHQTCEKCSKTLQYCHMCRKPTHTKIKMYN